MSRILVNDRCLYRRATGVAMYLRNLLRFWPEDCPAQPVGFCRSRLKLGVLAKAAGSRATARLTLEPLSCLGAPRWIASGVAPPVIRALLKVYRAAMRAECRRNRYAAYLEPNHLAVSCGKFTVTTVHDLSVLEWPEWHPPYRVANWRANLPASIEATDRWIAVSQFIRDRMVELLGIDRERITVAPLGPRALPYPDKDQLPRLKRRMGLPEQFLLHLGAIEPRKNLPVVLDAYAALPPETRRKCRLILAGPPGWGQRSFWRRVIEHPAAREVLLAGYVGDETAALMLAGAAAVLAPSRYEGFGLPVLEAMACGTAVIHSTAAALCEVAGGAGQTVQIDDVEGWTAAMRQAADEPDWRAELGRAGAARAATFSWQRTAKLHAEVFVKHLAAATAVNDNKPRGSTSDKI